MSGTRALKTKRRKLDSIISKLKVHPSQEAVDLPNESLKPKNQESEKDNEKDNESRTNLDSVKKKSKRKSKVIVRYRINDDDDEEDDNDDIEVTEDTTCAIPTETSQDKDEIEEVEEEAPLKDSQLPETIFEELPNGDAMSFDGENTTVLFLPAEDIQVQTGPSDDYLGDLLDGADDSNHEEQEEEEEKGKGKKKKKKKSKTYESDESLDEDGLPRRVMCTACGRKVNPSHGTILRHPVLNVLVCKKCNQYYNSGPFTRDEYGIEEQCRWCGDGGDLICCDDCEKVYCKPCLQRNCGKTYLKNLINAPEDFKWLCIACEKEKPPKHIQRLRKKCDQVMQTLDNIKAQKAHFKSKKGQQPSVVSGPTTSERRSRLNCLSEGIKAEGFSSSGESPTKKCFGADLPAELFSKVDDENQEDQTEIELNEKDASKEDEEKGEEKEESEHDSQDPGSESKLPNERDADGETKESETKIQEMDTESSGEVLRTSLRSRSKDKESKDNKTSNKVEEKEKEDDEQEEEEEVQGSSEKIPKRKTRSQHRQESKEEEENDSDAKSTSDDDTATISKEKKVFKSKKTQDEELSSMESESPELEDETSSPEENVRATRSGKRQIAKTRTRAGSKDTPQQSEEDENVKNSDKRRKKVKTVVDKVKQENASDEQDSSDSTSGKRLSRTSKDKANKLIIKKENTKVNKKQESKTVIVIDLDDESEDKEDENTEEQSKAKKLEKGKDSQSSKGKKKTVDTSVKKEKSSDSSDSNSKLTRSKRKGKTPVSLEKGKKDSKKDSKKISESESDDSDTNISPKRTKRNQKRQAELSSDSDFQKGKSSKKAATNKKQNKLEQSSDSDVMDTPEKDKPENSDFSLEESSESDEKSSDSESDVQPTSSRSRGLQKQTRKRPRPVESDSESQPSSEESSDNSGVAKRTRKKKQIESDTSDDGAKKRKSVVKNKREKKTVKKGRKLRKRKGAPESEESEASDKEESSDSEPEKKTKKGKQKKKQKGKKPAKKKTRRRVKDNSNDESSDDETEEKSPTKGRKKIRKLLTDEKLNEETKKARRLEEERRNRLLERTRTAEEEEAKPESSVLSTIVLEKDKETKEPLVEVESDLVQHLKPHQSKGIQFMYDNIVDSLESYKKGDKGGGCILAHCMGLGKTLQVVSLIHTLHNHKEFEFRTTLIIAPLNTVLNWQVEFDKWLSVDERMEVYVLKEAGHNNWHRADMLKQWQRYGGIMIIGYDSYRNLSQCQRIRSKHQKKIFKESLVDPGPDIVVCDEGHILRNDQSAVSKAINSIRTRRRIALTGTPLQNNLVEYHCMVSFVKPNLLGTRKEFMNLFGNPIMNGQCNDSSPMDVKIMKQSSHVLYKLLEACVQRRDYSVLTPFLPPKHEYVVKIRLSETQRKLYSHYLSTFVFPEGGAMSGRGPSLFSDYQCLSRIWTHPWCLKLEAIRRSLRAPYSDSDNSLDGFVVHTDEESESEPSSDEMSIKSDNSTPKKPKNKKNGEVFELKSSSEEGESANDNNSDEEVLPQKSSRLTRSTAPIVDKVTVAEDNKKGLNGDVDSFESSTRSGNNFKEDMPEEKEWYDEFIGSEDEYNVELSGKLALLLEILADAEAVEEKVLVFSQSLVTLDLIERALGGGEVGGDRENWCRGCDYFRMDGSTNVQYRQRWSDIFNDVDNKTARLFLISTKAGGLGINLVAANRVVVFDVSWNPSHDVQSIFRVFRFGQTKPVYVYRLVSEGTMEERIYDRQIAKLSTSQRVIDKHQIERHFTAADLSELYRFNPSTYDEEKDKDSVPSLPLPKDAVLADLINRMHPKWIVKYHEHDSLLQNVEAEQLNEDEMKQAWAAYEAQKNQASQNFNARALQAQYAQQQLQQQRQAVPSQNMNYSNSVLQQMQQYQRQQLARIQAQSAMQRQYLPALPADQQLHSEQLRQQLLQHLGANRPVYQAPAGTTYQQMMSYLQQQPPANRIIRLPSTPQQQPNPTQPNPTQPTNIVLGRGQPTYRM